MTDLDLLDLHIEALFTHDRRGRISRVNEPKGEAAPRFFLGRTRTGNRWRVRHDLNEELVEEMDRAAAEIPVSGDLEAIPAEVDAILRLLGEGAAVNHSGPAYRFPQELPEPIGATRITRETFHFLIAMGWNSPWLFDAFDQWQPIMAIVHDGQAVSTCFSSRLTSRSAEAGLETDGSHRNRGYGSAVTTAWAKEVRASGRVPLYSTDWENRPSRQVAQNLGLRTYSSDLSID